MSHPTPYLCLPGLARQVAAAWRLRRLTGWRKGWHWARRHAAATIPVAAGAVGMGCIGFAYHPVWEVTRACNLRCVHCHAGGGPPEGEELTTAEGRTLIDQLAAERRFRMLVFSGGEPLVRPDLPDLLARSRDRGLINVIATNGTLLDDVLARDLRRRNVRCVAVSLDHTDPAIHNGIRRDGRAFQRAIDALRACREAGIMTQVNFTAMQANLDNLEDMLRLCDDAGAAVVLCYQVVPMGRGASLEALDERQNERLLERIAAAQAAVTPIVEPVAGPQYWARLLAARRAGGRATWLDRKLFHGCAAGWGLAYIKPDGEVWPCPFVPVSGGNVRQRPFGRIWRDAPLFRALRARDLAGRCGPCRHKSICRGCRAKAYACSGDPLGEDPACFLHG